MFLKGAALTALNRVLRNAEARTEA